MSKCVYCHERKGKRACPALNGQICSQCCGEHRMAHIACPDDCVYLDANSAYQQKRSGERFALARREFYKTLFDLGGERAAALFNLVEVSAYGSFHHRRDSQDADVIAGVQALRRTLSPLHIPSGPAPVFAERLKKEYDAFLGHQAQQKDAGAPVLDQQTAMDVLDRALSFITEVSGHGLQSRRFLTGLIGFIDHYHPDVAEHLTKDIEEAGRILLPGDVPPGGVAPASATPPQGLHQHHHHHHR
jgi:hypothetical protein